MVRCTPSSSGGACPRGLARASQPRNAERASAGRRRRHPLRFALVLLVLGLTAAGVSAAPRELQVVLVQYRIGPDHDLSLSSFRARVDGLVGRAVRDYGAELLVFPEYLSVFPLVADLQGVPQSGASAPASASATASPALALNPAQRRLVRQVTRSPEATVTPRERRQLRELVRRRARRVNPPLRAMWAQIADEHDVWILAGSAFVEARDGSLRNRAWFFNPDGELEYRQDKVFLTDFEAGLLGLEPGSLRAVRPVTIDGVELGLTICRDSFFDHWHRVLGEVDLWLDIRANGEPWTPEVRERFDTALPERVASTAVPLGASTSLNGRFRDLVWQGPAFVVDDDGERIRQAASHDATLLLPLTVRAEPDVGLAPAPGSD